MTISRKTFIAVYEKCNGFCFYCGWPYVWPGADNNLRDSNLRERMIAADPDVEWVIEHMTPKSRGGSDELDNLTLACSKCNRAKGTRTVEEFRASIQEKVENFVGQATSVPGFNLSGPVGRGLLDASMQFWYHTPPFLFHGEKPADEISIATEPETQELEIQTEQ